MDDDRGTVIRGIRRTEEDGPDIVDFDGDQCPACVRSVWITGGGLVDEDFDDLDILLASHDSVIAINRHSGDEVIVRDGATEDISAVGLYPGVFAWCEGKRVRSVPRVATHRGKGK